MPCHDRMDGMGKKDGLPEALCEGILLKQMAGPIRPVALLGVISLMCLLLMGVPFKASAREVAQVIEAGQMAGGITHYSVRKKDMLLSIRGQFGVSVRSVIRMNHLSHPDRIFPGEILLIDNRHLVPKTGQDGIVINIAQKRLFFFQGGKLVLSTPVALGMPTWKTPAGTFHLVRKETNPVWVVPLSIQRDMKYHGEKVLKRVSPGPDNPLGKYWLGLSIPGYGIHGTNAPSSIFGFTTHGCIRLPANAILRLFHGVMRGTPVRIMDAPILFFQSGTGKSFLEVHPDPYHPGLDLRETFKHWELSRPGLPIDQEKAERVLKFHDGHPVDVSRQVGHD